MRRRIAFVLAIIMMNYNISVLANIDTVNSDVMEETSTLFAETEVPSEKADTIVSNKEIVEEYQETRETVAESPSETDIEEPSEIWAKPSVEEQTKEGDETESPSETEMEEPSEVWVEPSVEEQTKEKDETLPEEGQEKESLEEVSSTVTEEQLEESAKALPEEETEEVICGEDSGETEFRYEDDTIYIMFYFLPALVPTSIRTI